MGICLNRENLCRKKKKLCFFFNINTGNAEKTVGAILQIILQMFFDAAGNNNCQWEAALLSIENLKHD